MRFEEAQDPNAKVEYRGGDLHYRFANKPKWFAVSFLCVWLCIWSFGGIGTISNLASGSSDGLPLGYLFLAMWALGLVAAAASLAWMLIGSESITANATALTYTLHIGPFTYSRHYRPHALGPLQWRDGDVGGSVSNREGSKPSAITASYGTKTLVLLSGIDQAEALPLIERLRSVLGQRSSAQ